MVFEYRLGCAETRDKIRKNGCMIQAVTYHIRFSQLSWTHNQSMRDASLYYNLRQAISIVRIFPRRHATNIIHRVIYKIIVVDDIHVVKVVKFNIQIAQNYYCGENKSYKQSNQSRWICDLISKQVADNFLKILLH